MPMAHVCVTPAAWDVTLVNAGTAVGVGSIGRARLIVPSPVVAEWWQGRTDARDAILAATRVVASVDAAKTAGMALARLTDVDSGLTVDSLVMATAALLDAVLLTGDPAEFDRLGAYFPGVAVLAT
jgi:predicted nucleic acid-binding protein